MCSFCTVTFIGRASSAYPDGSHLSSAGFRCSVSACNPFKALLCRAPHLPDCLISSCYRFHPVRVLLGLLWLWNPHGRDSLQVFEYFRSQGRVSLQVVPNWDGRRRNQILSIYCRKLQLSVKLQKTKTHFLKSFPEHFNLIHILFCGHGLWNTTNKTLVFSFDNYNILLLLLTTTFSP